MYRFIESIKLQNRQLQHIEWHNRRFNETRRQLFGLKDELDLEQLIEIPSTVGDGIYKCRVLYNKLVEDIQFQPYFPKVVKTLQLVEDNEIDYSYKYEDRQALELLLTQKKRADEMLVVKNGHITDTSYSNIVFFDGQKWVTPDTYLLNGTQRQRLLAEAVITEATITPSDLINYTAAKLINAMLDFETTPSVIINK